MKRLLQWLALILAVSVSVLLAFQSVYSVVTSGSNGSMVESSATLVQVNGLWAIVMLAVPIAISLLPLFTRGRAWQPLSITAAILLVLAVFLGGGFSIGLFFVPAMVGSAALNVRPAGVVACSSMAGASCADKYEYLCRRLRKLTPRNRRRSVLRTIVRLPPGSSPVLDAVAIRAILSLE